LSADSNKGVGLSIDTLLESLALRRAAHALRRAHSFPKPVRIAGLMQGKGMAAAARIAGTSLSFLVFFVSASIPSAFAGSLRSHDFNHAAHNCGGHHCWESRRHHGHSRYHRDAGDHVSFRLFQKKF
jgi:hypothetical protein